MSVNQYLTSMSIEDILRITIEAHDGLKDLNGNPAIPHPLAVGLAGENELEQKVGFLHDVVEDSPITIADLRARGVEEDVLEAVDLLTHRSGMTYHEYVRNIVCSGNLTAMRVKLNDLYQNQQRARETFRTQDFSGTAGERKLDELQHIVERHDWAVRYLEDALIARA